MGGGGSVKEKMAPEKKLMIPFFNCFQTDESIPKNSNSRHSMIYGSVEFIKKWLRIPSAQWRKKRNSNLKLKTMNLRATARAAAAAALTNSASTTPEYHEKQNPLTQLHFIRFSIKVKWQKVDKKNTLRFENFCA